MSELRKHVVQLADAYEAAEDAGQPVIELGKQLLAGRERLVYANRYQLCTCVPECLGEGPCPVCGSEMCPF